MVRFLVTGGAGYIGSVLVEYLLDYNPQWQVTVLDNFMYRQQPFNHLCINDQLNIVQGDCRDRQRMMELLRTHDVIIPLAAIVGAPACGADPHAAHSTNLAAIRDLKVVLSNNQQVIFPTTNSGYGVGGGAPCTEDTPLKPVSNYGIYKTQAEELLLQRENTISFRLATVFGMSPRMRLDLLVNDFVYRALKDRALVIFEGHFRRNYIHVRDVASAFIHAMEHFRDMRGQAYNVGLSSANLTKLELAYAIHEHIPDLTILQAQSGRDPDQRDYLVSNEKMERTGWKPYWSLAGGIDELIKGFQQLRGLGMGNV